MRIHRRFYRRLIAAAGLVVIGSSIAVPLLVAQATPPAATAKTPPTTPAKTTQAAPAAPATAKPAASTATAAQTQELDGGWPRDSVSPLGAAVRIFQPQVASWDGQRQIVLFSAVSYTARSATKPGMGTIKIESGTSVSTTERLVNFNNFKLMEANFPSLTNDQLKDVVSHITTLVPQDGLVLGLDRVLARLDKSTIVPKNVPEIKADPPPIFYSTTEAAMVNIDGDPIWSPIKDTNLKFAVNTNWDLFQLAPDNDLYLRYEKGWLTAKDIKGPWSAVSKAPDAFKKLPADPNWADVKQAVPGEKLKGDKLPKVFVSNTPAELILLKGPPVYLPVTNTSLLWVSNTESDVFRVGQKGTVYFLISGRWFSAPDFTGPWTFATQNLPEDFKKIPPGHDRSRVLASVPGSDQAIEAVLLAQIPQTARVSKSQVKAPDVSYQGDPNFQPIEKTTLSRAVNTDKDIIKVGDLYYMCFEGVWFMGRSPNGPWSVTGSVPGEIYEIPISNPAHNVTYVTVEDDDDDAVVFATAAAYTGMMVAWGCVVWGSGWYYPPYVGYGGFYPYYRPYYPTYGYHASYNPWTGAYSRGAFAYGPYGGAGVGARYNPRTGTYSRGAAAYGPYGARGVAEGYNPRTGTYAQTRQGSNVYGSWGSTGVARGDNWATTSRVTNRATGNTTRVTQGSGGGEAITRTGNGNTGGVARTGSGDVYAGRDGNVYKKTDSGWQKYDNAGGNWGQTERPSQLPGGDRPNAGSGSNVGSGSNIGSGSNVGSGNRPTAGTTGRTGIDSSTYGQLDRDSAARAEGAQRSRDASTTRSRSGSGASSGSYRPSGGASRSMPRGGGGRRR